MAFHFSFVSDFPKAGKVLQSTWENSDKSLSKFSCVCVCVCSEILRLFLTYLKMKIKTTLNSETPVWALRGGETRWTQQSTSTEYKTRQKPRPEKPMKRCFFPLSSCNRSCKWILSVLFQRDSWCTDSLEELLNVRKVSKIRQDTSFWETAKAIPSTVSPTASGERQVVFVVVCGFSSPKGDFNSSKHLLICFRRG